MTNYLISSSPRWYSSGEGTGEGTDNCTSRTSPRGFRMNQISQVLLYHLLPTLDPDSTEQKGGGMASSADSGDVFEVGGG